MEKLLAFISYSRRDKSIANWLHGRLERYVYPKSFVRPENFPPDTKYMRPVFLDTKDLTVDTHPFNENIKVHLERSRYLVLICSVNSAKSEYVEKEVAYFLATHDNDYDLIIPFFIDDVRPDRIPPCIKNTPVMNRHFPIYNTTLSEGSEVNNYCLFQIISFLLKVDFSVIYNRYESYAQIKRTRMKRFIAFVFACTVVVILSLVSTVYKNNQLINQTEELVQFERDVFPHSLVTGYTKNFLSPVIEHMKEKGEKFKIYILMPTTQEDIESHKKRMLYLSCEMSEKLGVDSLTNEKLTTRMKRGTIVSRICCPGNRFDDVIIDFATTTSAFLDVARYKKQNISYKNESLDNIISGYAETFINQTKEELGSDSVYVEMFTHVSDMVERLDKEH